MISFKRKYQAIVERDPQYEGLFIVAVKTTGIFCRPVCSARKPKIENVEFFDTAPEAISKGYRACKVCKPLENSGSEPQYIRSILKRLKQDPHTKIKDKDLRAMGLEPNRVRRWFAKNYGYTFHHYQRKLKLNNAQEQLDEGKSVIQTAFDSGFDSLSGFNHRFQNIFGNAPTRDGHHTVLHMTRVKTPLGPMFAAATDRGVCFLEFADQHNLQQSFERLQKLLTGVLLPGEHPHLKQLETELEQYFDGRLQQFTVPLHLAGTEFQTKAWRSLLDIPYAQTRSYGQQARAISRQSAIRAVARANAQNRLAVIIPCHRVVGSDGKLRGYAGGLHRKKWLLEHEKSQLS
jgi:AraC family transcriptional regulator of adaptative response/methylated-DNA-[protein]-cysteine methyltransferase